MDLSTLRAFRHGVVSSNVDLALVLALCHAHLSLVRREEDQESVAYFQSVSNLHSI